nr:hypothetical protein [Mammaliicoccus sp. Marseille-Q6498]
MKAIVKAVYTTYYTHEFDSNTEEEMNMELDTLAKICPTEFLDTHKIKLNSAEIDEIKE